MWSEKFSIILMQNHTAVVMEIKNNLVQGDHDREIKRGVQVIITA